jgi:beta-glucanase (GH16 family)
VHKTPSAILAFIIMSTSSALSAIKAEDAPQVVVQTTDYVETSDGVRNAGEHISTVKGDHWLSYDVEIPVAGRYRIDVLAKADSSEDVVLYIMDYVNNQDSRNYNITANMTAPPGDTFKLVGKDGAPLNAGKHEMKLFAEGGPVSVESIKFSLIKRHERTPFTFVQNVEGDDWALIWSDEFETDGLPDPRTWAYDIGNWGWGNNESQYYTTERLENARCENGRLIVEARKDQQTGDWTSARLTTRGRMSLLYGRIEFSAMVPAGDGAWAAIWLLGDSYRDEVSWPYCGEIDILENVGREIDDQTGDGINHFSCHTRAYYFKQGNHISSQVPVKNLTGEFHNYAIEWTPKSIKMFLDGEHKYTYDKTANELEFPFNKPQNLVVNMAMGGGMGGQIDPKLTSQKMEIEYIRVYGRQ